ncbi:hypothetical protein [Scrofimicrobium canadense]|nr:hypothetical protein [Scrofimicrobium canadense]
MKNPDRIPPIRLVLLFGAMLALLCGLDAALVRLGLNAPYYSVELGSIHGLLMVYGFLGTAISLERAVALQSDRRGVTWWAYLGPAASALAVITVLVQSTTGTLLGGRLIPALLWGAAMAFLLAMYRVIWHKQSAHAVLIQVLGAFAGLGGILLWGRGYEIAQIVPWWTMFLVLTIIGERVELARISFLRQGTEKRVVAEASILTVLLPITLMVPQWGYPLFGITLVATILDVCWHDVARNTIRGVGLTRFMAACMLSGYGWALLSGGIWLVCGPVFSGYGYDTVVHALTVGFALSMVMAHAPVIVPAIARRTVPYHQAMWAVWALLQAGLIVRTISGAREANDGWQLGGALDVVAVLAFVLMTVSLIAISGRKRHEETAPQPY